MENSLKWSASYFVAPPGRFTKQLRGDKICLPPSALGGIISASPAPQDPYSANRFPPSASPLYDGHDAHARSRELPYPLTFRLVNPQNDRVIHSGILEFSAEEDEVVLGPFLLQSLGIEESDFAPVSNPSESREDEYLDKQNWPKLTIHAAQLPKGEYVRLRPLEAGYDTEDWKALLERYLGTNFTTLTVGELLSVHGRPDEVFQFLVDKVQPEGNAICVVDTDLEVDIEPLDEEQARESERRRRERLKAKSLAKGGNLQIGREIQAEIVVGQYVDFELKGWNHSKTIDIRLDAVEDADIDMFVSPFSPKQRARPRQNEHVFGDFSSDFPKHIRMQPTNIELENAESIYISIYARQIDGTSSVDEKTWKFSLKASELTEYLHLDPADDQMDSEHTEDEECRNCHQWVPKRTIVLHENFCLRNNIQCQRCKRVYQKRSAEWQNHWHCPHDEAFGNDTYSRDKHDAMLHIEKSCKDCQYNARNIPDLAQHRTTTCPAKLILCQFCHLIVPQKGDGDPDVFDPEVLLSNLTPHEYVDGTRTSECHLCGRIIRLREMNTHLRHHDLERLSRSPPELCTNPNCCNTFSDLIKKGKVADNPLGLCNTCFGPLYVNTYDPDGTALRRRLERRYLTQMISGCSKPWCRNEYCKTGRSNMGLIEISTKESMPLIKPLINAVSIPLSSQDTNNSAPLYFCTDENNQSRKKLAEFMASEGEYELGWTTAAAQEAAGDLDKAREWLKNWAPKKGETFNGS